ncbi:MAG: amidase [Verrucomicrobia bacterium]|nr:amidase [Verrucomicrobiota bacterium]
MPTSAGFIFLKDSLPPSDATVIKRLRDAGAIILIKANLSDWFGVPDREAGHQSTVLKSPTLNPYNLRLIPGGSSGGSGAAVAAGFSVIALGTETGVSIRNPAANNSLVALAPTRGLIPRTGVTMTSFQQERVGPMAKSVIDVAVAADVLAGFDAGDLLTVAALGSYRPDTYLSALQKDGLRGARIGVFRDLFRSGSQHAEGIALVESAIAVMRESGATIIDSVSTGIDLIGLFPEMRTNYWEGQFSYDLYFRELGPNALIRDVDHLIEVGGELVKPNIVRARNEFTRLEDHPEYLARLKTQQVVRDAILEIMDRYQLDALVHPFKSVPPEGIGQRQDEKDNPVSSITGLPALLVPVGYAVECNGPISIEFLGRPFSEATLFRLAFAYEQKAKVWRPAPTTPPLSGEVISY